MNELTFPDSWGYAMLVLLVPSSFILYWPLGLFIVLVILSVIAASHLPPKRVSIEPVPFVDPVDARVRSLQQLRLEIIREIRSNEAHPVVASVGIKIIRESNHLLGEATEVARKLIACRALQRSRSDADEEIALARMEAEREKDPDVRAMLLFAAARREADLANVADISAEARHWNALLGQAEATLLELQSNLGLALAASDDYVRAGGHSGLAESSRQLRILSEAMRRTVAELE